MRKLLTFLMLLCFLGALNTRAFEVDGIEYGPCTGGWSIIIPEIPYRGDIIIPETVTYNGETRNVVAISNEAFKDNRRITSITLPNTVTQIGDYAFYGCSKLNKASLGTGIKTLGRSTFYKCESLEYIFRSIGGQF